MTANEFFRALLAALAVKDRRTLDASHSDVHRAFFQVLREIRKPEMQARLQIEDLIDIDYDPLYGQSRWFDRALTRAQRDRIVSFPNPSYDTITIKYAPETGRAVLAEVGSSQEAIEGLADVFAEGLRASEEQQPEAISA
jgi:hypothetical protein